jgi:hypothetical protein
VLGDGGVEVVPRRLSTPPLPSVGVPAAPAAAATTCRSDCELRRTARGLETPIAEMPNVLDRISLTFFPWRWFLTFLGLGSDIGAVA